MDVVGHERQKRADKRKKKRILLGKSIKEAAIVILLVMIVTAVLPTKEVNIGITVALVIWCIGHALHYLSV